MSCKNKIKQKISARKHYLANKQKIINRARLNSDLSIKRNKEFIDNYLKEHSCVDCGNTNIIVLEFDHIKGIKKYNIAELKLSSMSLKTIELEINKCEVRCANCHRIVTYNRRNNLIKEL